MRSVVLASLLFALTASACGKNSSPPPPTSGSPFAKPESAPTHAKAGDDNGGGAGAGLDKAQQMYSSVCIGCHGANGKADGPMAANLNPKPRDYTDPAWQASVTDDQIKKTILMGGAGVGKSPMMPAQPQLQDDPAVLDGLVQIIRGFGKK